MYLSIRAAILLAFLAVVYCHEDGHHSHTHSSHHHTHSDYEGEESNELEHEHYGEEGEHNDEFDHEAVIGSKKEAELFHSLTAEEAKQRLAEIVRKIDGNGDGLVSESELKLWLKQNLRKLDVEAAEEEFAKHDLDANGVLTWAEYIRSQYGYSMEEIEKFAIAPSDQTLNFLEAVEDDKTRWAVADLNKDGDTDLQEYVAFLSPFNYEHMQEYEVDRVLGQFDDSADGTIDLNEFEIHEADGELDEEARLSIGEQFRELDKNADAKLERNEIREWVAPGLDDSAELEARHLFEMTNADGDEQHLTLDEILDHHTLWVGSEEDDSLADFGDEQDEDEYDDMHTEL